MYMSSTAAAAAIVMECDEKDVIDVIQMSTVNGMTLWLYTTLTTSKRITDCNSPLCQ